MNKGRTINSVQITVSAEVNTMLSDLYNQIEYELRDDYEDGLEKAMKELDKYKNIIDELEKWLDYQAEHTMQQHNYYGVLDKLKELKGSDN